MVWRSIYALLKILALFVGLAGSLLGLMALTGLVLESFWVRLGIAAVVLILVPLLIANGLIPKESDKGLGEGVISDTFALVWLGLAALLVGAGAPVLGSTLEEEVQRLHREDRPALAQVARLLVGPADTAQATPILADSASTSAPTSAPTDKPTDKPADKPTDKPADKSADKPASAPTEDDSLAKEDDTAAETKGSEETESAAKDTDALTPAELFERYAKSVVTVNVRTSSGRGGGTGFILDGDGTLATNHHVIDDAESVRIKLFDGTWIEKVELLESDEGADLALLKIQTDLPLKPVDLGESAAVVVGERVVSIGNPLGLDHTLTDGLVSARRVWSGRRMIQMSAPVSPGNSGGPLFNMRGEVIGITTAKLGNFMNNAEGLNLAVPVDVLKGMLKPSYAGRHTYGSSSW